MAATISGTPTGQYNWGSSSIVVDIPAIPANGTASVVIVTQDDYLETTITPPSGWQLRDTTDPAYTDAIEDSSRTRLYTKKSVAGESATTATWTLGASKQWAAGAWCTTEDYQLHSKTDKFGSGTASWVSPDVTVPTVAGTDALVVSVVFPVWYARTRTATPAGYTLMTDLGDDSDSFSYCNVIAGYKAVGTGATGTATWTVGDTSDYGGFAIVYTNTSAGGTITISGGGAINFDNPSGDSEEILEDEDFVMILQQSEGTAALREVTVSLIDSTDRETPKTGQTFSGADAKVRKAGGAEANFGGTFTELANGDYKYVFTQAELDTTGQLTLRIAKTGVIGKTYRFQVLPWDPYNATDLGVTNILNPTLTTAQINSGTLDEADIVETGLTLRKFYRLVAAVLGGKLSGAGTGTETFRNAVADSKARVTASVDTAGNRTAITTDLT